MKFSILLRDTSTTPYEMIVEIPHELSGSPGSQDQGDRETFLRFVRVVKALLPIRRHTVEVCVNLSSETTIELPREFLNFIIETRWPLTINSQR